MGLGRAVFLKASRSSWLADHLMKRAFARRAVRRFMPGEEPGDALDAAQQLAPARGAVLTQLGENITTLAEAQAVREHYLGVLEQIGSRSLAQSVISVKPTQLGLDLSFDACLAHLEVLAKRAKSSGAGLLWIDMEDSS